jgi:hypothetical protein
MSAMGILRKQSHWLRLTTIHLELRGLSPKQPEFPRKGRPHPIANTEMRVGTPA